jgi:hypothetical protein
VTRVKTGRKKTVHSPCLPGGKARVEAERYEGTIEFHGEEGFADVSATSAPLIPGVVCDAAERAKRSDGTLPGVRLDVERRRRKGHEGRIEFDAVQRHPGGRTTVAAEIDEYRGEMVIQRVTGIVTSVNALRYADDLRTATLKSPAPFAGHAKFRRRARPPHRWTGSLTVDFPGHSGVRLTGRGFSAELEHRRR